MALELENTAATILDVNPRKEGAGEDKVLACDIKLRIDMPAADVLPYFHPELRSFLFNDNGCRFPALGTIGWDCTMEHMEIDAAGYVFADAKLSKFKIEPRYGAPLDTEKLAADDVPEQGQLDVDQGRTAEDIGFCPRVTLTFTAAVHPEASEIAALSELLQEEVAIDIRPRQGDLPL